MLLNNPGFFSGDFTIMYWFKTDATQNNRRMYLFSIDSIGFANNLNMELNDASGYWCYWNSQGLPGFWGESVNQYQDNQWHMAVFRRTGSIIDFFIDMNLKASYNAGAGVIGTNKTTLGGKISLGHNQTIPQPPLSPTMVDPWGFNGLIDDLSLYNVAVSTPVLNNYYNNYDLAAWFTFSGSLADSSGCENTAIRATTTGNNADLPALTNNRFSTANSAYAFNGNGVIKIEPFANNPVLGCINYLSNDFSISFWSRTAQNNRRQYAFSVDRSVNPPSSNLHIEFNDQDWPAPGFWAYWNGQGTPGINEGAMNKYSDNVWHFVTLTRNANSGWVTAYIDADTVGTYLDTLSTTLGNNTDTMDVGHLRSPYSISVGFDYGFIGELDEFKFHRHVLTPTEISNAYAHPNTAYRSTGITSKTQDAKALLIAPNPSHGRFYMASPTELGQVTVTDVTGKTVASIKMSGKRCDMNLEQLTPGIYFVQAYDVSHRCISTQKIIKE